MQYEFTLTTPKEEGYGLHKKFNVNNKSCHHKAEKNAKVETKHRLRTSVIAYFLNELSVITKPAHRFNLTQKAQKTRTMDNPIINFLIQATTQGVDAARPDFMPFEDVCGNQKQHGFTLTDPKEEG